MWSPRVDACAPLSPCSRENLERILSVFIRRPPKFFTFNDGWRSEMPKSAEFLFGQFLATLFPTPSQYEYPDAPWY